MLKKEICKKCCNEWYNKNDPPPKRAWDEWAEENWDKQNSVYCPYTGQIYPIFISIKHNGPKDCPYEGEQTGGGIEG